jgi:hypothetical protein
MARHRSRPAHRRHRRYMVRTATDIRMARRMVQMATVQQTGRRTARAAMVRLRVPATAPTMDRDLPRPMAPARAATDLPDRLRAPGMVATDHLPARGMAPTDRRQDQVRATTAPHQDRVRATTAPRRGRARAATADRPPAHLLARAHRHRAPSRPRLRQAPFRRRRRDRDQAISGRTRAAPPLQSSSPGARERVRVTQFLRRLKDKLGGPDRAVPRDRTMTGIQ